MVGMWSSLQSTCITDVIQYVIVIVGSLLIMIVLKSQVLYISLISILHGDSQEIENPMHVTPIDTGSNKTNACINSFLWKKSQAISPTTIWT